MRLYWLIPATRADDLLSSGKEWTPETIRQLTLDATGDERAAGMAFAESLLKQGERELWAGKL